MNFSGNLHKYGDNINTDVIIPTRYCTTIEAAELAKHCLADLDPQFVQKAKKGDLLVAGHNFGCGSSREVAPMAIKGAGIACVIAASFARIFYRNAVNIGFPIIECPELVRESENGHRLEVQFENNTIINHTTGKKYTFPTSSPAIREIIAAGGLVNYVRARISRKNER